MAYLGGAEHQTRRGGMAESRVLLKVQTCGKPER